MGDRGGEVGEKGEGSGGKGGGVGNAYPPVHPLIVCMKCQSILEKIRNIFKKCHLLKFLPCMQIHMLH